MSFLRRKSKKKPDDVEIEETPPKPARGWRNIPLILSLYFPLGMYQRALTWTLEQPSRTAEQDENQSSTEPTDKSDKFDESKIIYVKEKSFQRRINYFIIRTIIQSLGLTLVFTAPIALPWFFNIVIPYTIDIIPFGLDQIVRNIVESIVNFLSPFAIIAEAVTNLSRISGTYNPLLFYGATLFFFNFIGLSNTFEEIDTSEVESMTNLIADNYQEKFIGQISVLIPILLVITMIISYFLVIRRAKAVLFELQTEKEEQKRIKKIKNNFTRYYLDNGYSQVDYETNRASDSTKIKKLALFVKWGPLISVMTPVIMALLFIFL
ncbi:MAG: hypothetical protein ACXAD7_14100 [Candidatus Kariarchaeaceae archaeon]|jgi:hypothetical protein